MLRLLYAILLGLLGAGIVHIAVLFLVPQFSERDAWSRLSMESGLYRMTRLDAEAGVAPVVKSVDPLFYASSCRFDLTDGPLQLRAEGNVPFWSASVYDRAGQNIYSFNDHTSTDGTLDFVVLTPTQMLALRNDLPPAFEKSIFVEAPVEEGIVVVRSFVPDATWKKAVEGFLSATTCTTALPVSAEQ
jgi:uncharacterized membrane protein